MSSILNAVTLDHTHEHVSHDRDHGSCLLNHDHSHEHFSHGHEHQVLCLSLVEIYDNEILTQ